MAEARMPTTVPSPVDRGEFRFVAVDTSGATWHWIDGEMVWILQRTAARADGRTAEGGEVLR